MQHVYILYYFIAFVIGLVSLGIAILTYLKTKADLLLYYLSFHAAFTLLMGLNLGLGYIYVNITPVIDIYTAGSFAIIEYAAIFIVGPLVMLALIAFIYELFAISDRLRKLGIWVGILTAETTIFHLCMFASNTPAVHLVSYFLNGMVGNVAMLYGLMVGIMSYKHLQTPLRKQLARILIFTLGLGLPATVAETFLESLFSATSFYPILYSAISVMFTYRFVKSYLFPQPESTSLPQETPNIVVTLPQTVSAILPVAADPMPEADFFEQYEISLREREIIGLILQGSSNTEIGEKLFISLSTVKTHVRNIYAKLGVKSRYDLIAVVKKFRPPPT